MTIQKLGRRVGRHVSTGARLLPLAVLTLGAAACTAPMQGRPASAARVCNPPVSSLASKSGKEWLRANGWRFASQEDAARDYAKLLTNAPSPWPDWYQPYATVLPAGTRFQMAIGGSQTPQMPGGFGTFDNILRVRDVRAYLAVRSDWKPRVDRVVVYEVARPLPVRVGPIGPQVDPGSCRLLAGRWSQFEMTVPPAERLSHLRVVAVRLIK